MSRVGQKVKMTSLDELLCVPTIEGTNDIEIALIKQFRVHFFSIDPLRYFPLYCPKCKLEKIIDVEQGKIVKVKDYISLV